MKQENSDRVESQTVPLSDETAVKGILVDAVFGLWKVVNNLTRLQPTSRERYRVTIFGSARVASGTVPFEEVKRLAKAIVEMARDTAATVAATNE